jgi:hypothetical protein
VQIRHTDRHQGFGGHGVAWPEEQRRAGRCCDIVVAAALGAVVASHLLLLLQAEALFVSMLICFIFLFVYEIRTLLLDWFWCTCEM